MADNRRPLTIEISKATHAYSADQTRNRHHQLMHHIPGGIQKSTRKLTFQQIITTLLLFFTFSSFQVPQNYAIHFAQAQQVQPLFTKSMDSFNVRENTPVDETIYTLEAQDPDHPGVRMSYSIEGTQLFAVDRASGQVRVAQLIDREQTGDSLNFHVLAMPHSSWPGTLTKLPITVYVLDENDNPPRIERVRVGRQEYDAQALANSVRQSGQGATMRVPVIRLNVSEDTPAESVIVDLIEAIDVDKASSSPLSAVCLNCGSAFKLVPRTANLLNDHLEWSIVLERPLVHVPRQNVHQLNVIVSDGKFNSSLLFELTVDDVQNRPPHFVSSTTCVVHENTPIDRTILTLQAVDGDAIALDDGPMMISSSGGKPASSQYSGRQIVYDFLDQSGRPSSYQLDFKLNPLTGQLQVANRLDRESYLNVDGVLSLQVRARELTVDAETVVAGDELYESILTKLTSFVDASELSATVSEVTVILVDVNDNAPRWLNASEIVAMSRAPVWHQSLPADRDTGRNYQLKVFENSLPGSPITTKNELFVYDLDNGENAEFNITLDDPFNLFDVEPKRVSGFSSVTIKLAPIGAAKLRHANRLLDYENINERSYIIQLYAIETRTQEQFRSKAQVQISVVDVNDNVPEFREAAYVANIREDAPAGKMVKVVQATDRDEISRQITYSLHGHSAYLFNIHPISGLVTVARCDRNQQQQSALAMRSTRFSSSAGAAARPCIDFETQRQHHLMVEASDGELASKVPLTIYIEDASDNAPVFSLPIVDVVIEEGTERLEPPIRIEATDVDQTSTLSYSILEGNFEGLFAINNVTGELQLTRPIRIAHDDLSSGLGGWHEVTRPQQLNKMTLIVQASDGEHSTNGTIRIDILDANDNAPNFSRASYEKEITEAYAPGQSVLTVKAFDMDRGNNARVSYRLERGSHGQFHVNETTGEISVARQARPFDASKRENYTLEVVAYDHGLVSKSSSVFVLIKVLSTSKRAPEFEPRIQRETINENTLNNTLIHRMQISEPQQQRDQPQPMALMFEPGPIEGLDKYGQPVVELERLESMFSVSTHTGDVVVNSALNHDFAAHVNLTIYVSYRPFSSGGNSHLPITFDSDNNNNNKTQPNYMFEEYTPRSVGYLIINVVDDNNNAPIFAAPWSPSQPELLFQMLEELPVGSILTQLTASDADSKISHFEIEPPNEYFELTSPQSGVIVNKKLIDYDTLMRQTFLTPGAHRATSSLSSSNNIIQFNVVVYDSGLRQLSAKAIVSVEILPINDNDCKFEQPLYEVHLRENAPVDTLVSQVRATDLDYGAEHNSIGYQLIGELRDLFNIDARTGVITVSARGSLGLDREQLAHPVIMLTVVGRDEQQLKESSVESLPTLYRSSQVQARQKQAQPTVGGRSCSTTVRIHLDDVNDNPPVFTQRLYEVIAYDTDTVDVPLVKLIVHDEDLKHNLTTPSTLSRQHANSFRILSGNVNESFNITASGTIYVIKPLNESLSSTTRDKPIELRVQVKQQSATTGNQPPTLFTDECQVRVHFAKINRYAPEWKAELLKSVAIVENSPPGTPVAQLECFDRDFFKARQSYPLGDAEFDDSSKLASSKRSTASQSGSPMDSVELISPIRYWIKENGSNVLETSEFQLDSVSGQLVSRVELDREKRDLYQLIVACEDNGRPQSLESIMPLYVSVLDVDDNLPEFVVSKSQQLIVDGVKPSQAHTPSVQFYVEEHQSKGLQVGELKAVDRDLELRNQILYCLVGGDDFQEFSLDQVTGTLYTNKTLDREKQATYELLVKAINDGSTCDALIAAHQQQQSVNRSTSATTAATTAGNHWNKMTSFVKVRVDVQDINDNAPIFRRPSYRAAVHHRALMNTLVTQVAAFDPDHELNGTLNYRISEILLYKTSPQMSASQAGRTKHNSVEPANEQQLPLSKPIKLIQSPFKIDQAGNIYTQQLLTQYQLMSMFVVHIEASERAEPWRTASTKLEIYVYETNSQLKIRINLHPRLVENYRFEIESMLSNATKYKAIINRARSYYGNSADSSNVLKQPSSSLKLLTATDQSQRHGPTLDSTRGNLLDASEPNFSNIHTIFVESHRIVNPNVVMEKFDLSSAQLFTPQSLLSQQVQAINSAGGRSLATTADDEVSSLIDKIALASIQSAEFHASPSSLAGIDWLENPAILYVCLTSLLTLIGLLICTIGCCCTSRIKDHIIKVAMDKLVKQQTLQAKINERVLAATNQAYANSTLGNGNQALGSDFILQQSGGGLMSSFDATKNCMNNNYENMSILQRALEAGEFIDPNYTTLNPNGHHHLNLGAHYYDASELEQLEATANGYHADEHHQSSNGVLTKQVNGSVISLSLDEDEDDDEANEQGNLGGLQSGDLKSQQLKNQRPYTNGVNGGLLSGHQHSQQRQRQQIPANNHPH